MQYNFKNPVVLPKKTREIHSFTSLNIFVFVVAENHICIV
jgi:hypothetical protein